MIAFNNLPNLFKPGCFHRQNQVIICQGHPTAHWSGSPYGSSVRGTLRIISQGHPMDHRSMAPYGSSVRGTLWIISQGHPMDHQSGTPYGSSVRGTLRVIGQGHSMDHQSGALYGSKCQKYPKYTQIKYSFEKKYLQVFKKCFTKTLFKVC